MPDVRQNENNLSKVIENNLYFQDTCSTDKYAFQHEGIIQYDHSMPKLEQFTLCTWMRFTNHSGDHSLFTYSGKRFFFFAFYYRTLS